MRKKLLVLSLFLISGASAKEVPEVQVTATRVEVPVEHVGDDVDIITQEEIKKYGFTSIADVLKYVAGVHVSTVGGPGQSPYSVYMLGLPTKHILVMIDGVPINDPSLMDTQANFAYIDLNNVERIEVLKGAQGALYGSEAIAGVINIITKKPKENEFKFGFEGGKYKTFKENIYSALKLKDGYFSFAFENFKTNGFSAANDKNTSRYEADNDGYNYRTGWISYGWNLTDYLKISGNFKVKGGKVEYDNGVLDENTYTTYDNFFTNLNVDAILSDNLVFSTKFGNNKENREYSYGSYVGITRYFTLQPTYYVNQELFLTSGVSYKQEKAEIPFTGSPSVHAKSIFWEVHSDYYGIHTTIALRRDFHSKFGNKTTYKISTAYTFLSTNTTFKGQYGTGFKAPTLYQMYNTMFGNLSLVPDESEGWIVSLHQKLPYNLDLSISYFKNNIFSSVVWDYTNFKFINASGKTEGTETKLSWKPLNFLILTGSYTHLSARGDENFVLKRPENSYTAGLNLSKNKAKFSFWVEHYSSRKDGYYNQIFQWKKVTLPSFTTYNCYASYQLNDRVIFYLKGVNLTDKDYELAYGYNTMGRAFFAGVSLNFN